MLRLESMTIEPEEIANNFLEIASELRLNVLLSLSKKTSSLSHLAKEIDVTASELHRNLGRLQKADLIRKHVDGEYHLTLYGRTVCAQIPIFEFMLQNKKYFESHDFANLPPKFIQRSGALVQSEIVNGYAKVTEKWKNIYKNAQEYIYNILVDVPYNADLLEILENRLSHGIKIKSVFSESSIVPKERQEILCKFDFKKFIKNEVLERKMQKDIKIVLVLNEREAGISFPTSDGEADISKMFYSTDKPFHEWCFDYFREQWELASRFQEDKLG